MARLARRIDRACHPQAAAAQLRRTRDLPDLNVWLALTWPEHIHHQRAVQCWEQQAAEQVLSSAVTALLQALCRQPGVQLAEPGHDGWEVFQQLLRDGELPARLYAHAHRAALAVTIGWRLVSFDPDFERFAGLERLALPSVSTAAAGIPSPISSVEFPADCSPPGNPCCCRQVDASQRLLP
ncbi:MAG: hypothetical protein ACKOZT_14925 [Cyanobium sp.]